MRINPPVTGAPTGTGKAQLTLRRYRSRPSPGRPVASSAMVDGSGTAAAAKTADPVGLVTLATVGIKIEERVSGETSKGFAKNNKMTSG